MSPQFEIGGYTIKLGRRLPTRVVDQTITPIGFISFLGEDFMSMNVYFVDDDSPCRRPWCLVMGMWQRCFCTAS